MGEADDYFLNNAVHLLDNFLSLAEPPFEGSINYGRGQGTLLDRNLPEGHDEADGRSACAASGLSASFIEKGNHHARRSTDTAKSGSSSLGDRGGILDLRR